MKPVLRSLELLAIAAVAFAGTLYFTMSKTTFVGAHSDPATIRPSLSAVADLVEQESIAPAATQLKQRTLESGTSADDVNASADLAAAAADRAAEAAAKLSSEAAVITQ